MNFFERKLLLTISILITITIAIVFLGAYKEISNSKIDVYFDECLRETAFDVYHSFSTVIDARIKEKKIDCSIMLNDLVHDEYKKELGVKFRP